MVTCGLRYFPVTCSLVNSKRIHFLLKSDSLTVKISSKRVAAGKNYYKLLLHFEAHFTFYSLSLQRWYGPFKGIPWKRTFL